MKSDIVKLSIITVCYNSVAHIEATIKSVIEKESAIAEFIIIDGGSTDGTVEIIEKYREHLTFWSSEPDKGIYDAMNKGWRIAHPESYILYLGAGDKILQLPATESFINADVVVGDVELGGSHLYQGKSNLMLKLGNTIHHQAEFVRKKINPDPPFDIRYKIYADFNFNQQLLLKKIRFKKDPSFRSFALEGGVSFKFDKKEPLAIVKANFGMGYYLLARLYYFYKNGKL